MMELDSAVFTTSKSPGGTYWCSGSVYFWDQGIRYVIAVSSEVKDPQGSLDLVDAFRLLVSQLPGRLQMMLQENAEIESARPRPF